MAVDTPDYYPSRTEALNLPEVFFDDGVTRVDAAQNVREAIASLNLEGRRLAHRTEWLTEKRFYTHGMQMGREPDIYFGAPNHEVASSLTSLALGLERTIERNLSVYLDGTLTTTIEGKKHTFTDLWHPDGKPWVDDETRARLKDLFTRRARARRPEIAFSWSGMPCTLDGEPAELVYLSRPNDEETTWLVRPLRTDPDDPDDPDDPGTPDDTQQGSDRSPRRAISVRVPDSLLTASFVDGVIDGDGRLFEGLLGEDARQARLRELEASRRRAEEVVDALRRDIRVRSKEAYAKTGTGEYRFKEHTRAAMLEEVDELGVPLKVAEDRLLGFTRDIEAAKLAPKRGVTNAELADLSDGLRNPRTGMPRQVLRRAITDLAFISQRLQAGTRVGWSISWNGTVAFKTPDGVMTRPFSGQHGYGLAFDVETPALGTLAGMRNGVPLMYVSQRVTEERIADVARLFDCEPRDFRPGNVLEPQLLRLWMAALFARPARGERPEDVVTVEDLLADEELVEMFGGREEVLHLVERMRAVDAANRDAVWRVRQATREAMHLIWANTRPRREVSRPEWSRLRHLKSALRRNGRLEGWDFTQFLTPVHNPCPACGSQWLAPTRLREVSGYLCLAPDCRLDTAGVRWPGRFDRYIVNALDYVAAGVDLDLPEGYTGDSADLKAVEVVPIALAKRVTPLSEQAITDIAERYRQGELVRKIAAVHAIPFYRVYDALLVRQVPLRKENTFGKNRPSTNARA
ncbi:hypothetical protein ABFT23_02090 [Nocardioides sp. C4-1]|uniref:hypothetical protein n=1 Tax=Nocardioides sp. C4-1 TaxID=3151851 RepID=UPI0032656777